MHEAATSHGLLASITDATTHRNIWAPDSVICGLADIQAGDTLLFDIQGKFLQILANAAADRGKFRIRQAAAELLTALCTFTHLGQTDGQWRFDEYGHGLTGEPGGTSRMS